MNLHRPLDAEYDVPHPSTPQKVNKGLNDGITYIATDNSREYNGKDPGIAPLQRFVFQPVFESFHGSEFLRVQKSVKIMPVG